MRHIGIILLKIVIQIINVHYLTSYIITVNGFDIICSKYIS